MLNYHIKFIKYIFDVGLFIWIVFHVKHLSRNNRKIRKNESTCKKHLAMRLPMYYYSNQEEGNKPILATESAGNERKEN